MIELTDADTARLYSSALLLPADPLLWEMAVNGGKAATDTLALLLDLSLQNLRWEEEDIPVAYLNTVDARDYCGDRLYVPTRNNLIRAELMEKYAEPIVGKRSTGYRITFPLNQSCLYELQTRPALDRFQTSTLNADPLPVLYQTQVDFLKNDTRLVDGWFLGLENDKYAAIHRRWLTRLLTGRWKAVKDACGRLYTPLTQLRKDLRPRVLIGGVETVKWDVSNAAPFILACLFRETLYHAPDWKCYLEDCAAGRLYDRLAEESGIKKRAFKKPISTFLNDITITEPKGRKYDTFHRLYPSVWNEMVRRKRESGAGLYRQYVPRETDIIIPLVAELIQDGLPAASIHDCIACDPKGSDYVVYRLKAMFQAQLGVAPHVKPD